jgi:BirA family biotin operon repressor/biotin-[acetyl-CoA-carboxylase] ligase
MTLFGNSLIRHTIVSSTQDVARDLARQGYPPGTVVTAEQMTAGRGRQGRVWHTPTGANVCLTTIAPSVPSAQVWQVGLIGGVAVAEALQAVLQISGKVAPLPILRFPNDVLLNERKVSGILVETISDPTSTSAVIPLIGIGVNVLSPGDALPPEVATHAISLSEAVPGTWNTRTVEAKILASLTATWQVWENDGFAAILPRFDALRNRYAYRPFLIKGDSILCRVEELSLDGWLTLETAEGERAVLHVAEVLLGDFPATTNSS